MHLYLHIPFCKQACHYCDFHFSTTDKLRSEMIDSILKEMHYWHSHGWGGPCKSVYFGGGTPSILENEEIQRILHEIETLWGIEQEAEITLEANPDDIDPNSLKDWWNSGINRLSLGVQSFYEDDLKWMNRSHDSKQAIRSLEYIKDSSFSNYSLDLIYGVPTKSDFSENVIKALSFDPPHISAYTLTVEPKTVLAHKVEKGKQLLLQDKEVEEQYQSLCEALSSSGYSHYEISNFAKKESVARHNSAYWKGDKYLGVGPSAHSFDGERRWWNVANNTKYRNAVSTGSIWFETEELTANSKWNELLMTGLRRSVGIALETLSSKLPQGEELPLEDFRNLESEGLIQEVDGHWRIPEIHWLLSDHIIMKLML
jgi:oxygen-independent coproporphyrinogen-3 oxidase